MSVNQLIQFLTKELIVYMETPTEVRKQRRVAKREQRKTWSSHWFGAVPLAIGMFVKRRKL